MNQQNTSFLNKGISAPIGILVIVLAAAIAGAGIFAYQYYWSLEEEVEIPEETQPKDETADWKTYRNEEYGFEIKYPTDFKVNQNEEIYFSSLNYGDTRIKISVDKNLSVPLDGTFGGRYQYLENQQIDSKVFSEKSADFNKDYFIAYGGMGSWDTVINSYQYKNTDYYIVSLYRGRQLGASSTEIINQTLIEMRDENNDYTKIFNKILSTFRFLE